MVKIKSQIPRGGRTVLLSNGKEYTFSLENTIEVEDTEAEALLSSGNNLELAQQPTAKPSSTLAGNTTKKDATPPVVPPAATSEEDKTAPPPEGDNRNEGNGQNTGSGENQGITATPPSFEEIRKKLEGKKNDDLKMILKEMEVPEEEYATLRKELLVDLILSKTQQ